MLQRKWSQSAPRHRVIGIQAAGFKGCKYIESYETADIDSADFQTSRSGGVIWATVAMIRVSDVQTSSFLGGTNELQQAKETLAGGVSLSTFLEMPL